MTDSDTMDDLSRNVPQRDGSSVSNGRTVPLLGSDCPISKNLSPVRLLSIPSQKWWVPYILKKPNAIIAKVKSQYHKQTHKFGIRIPKTVQEARELDRINGNNLWEQALGKEMSNVRLAFKMLNKEDEAPVGHTKIKCHIVFDVKMEKLRRKCRMVAGGHMTEASCPSATYLSVVSCESVQIALTFAALNAMEVKAADI
ncbi:unnamed protein product [Cylindrotheca closterium]|uniref:Uncharacterized protein n=1 Tax=Cylindrotheca closterium TaxID=2856 RepID=A0AAD2G1M4_9STRA|nr:unnamed protein product [Cylindrotheca closterium]